MKNFTRSYDLDRKVKADGTDEEREMLAKLFSETTVEVISSKGLDQACRDLIFEFCTHFPAYQEFLEN